MPRQEPIDADYLAPAMYDQYYGAYATLPDWFLADLASRGQVLELACGTGRIAIPLAEQGIKVAGMDYSRQMLSLARSKAETRQVKVDWIDGDMRRFEIGTQYGSILLLHNALWHLHDLSDFEDCIRCVRLHLAPGAASSWMCSCRAWRSSIVTPADDIHSLAMKMMKPDERCR